MHCFQKLSKKYFEVNEINLVCPLYERIMRAVFRSALKRAQLGFGRLLSSVSNSETELGTSHISYPIFANLSGGRSATLPLYNRAGVAFLSYIAQLHS